MNIKPGTSHNYILNTAKLYQKVLSEFEKPF